MKRLHKYTLILFIIFNILFISNIFAKDINDTDNIDYSKYYLKGLFTKKCFPEIDKDYCDTKYFHIYDNKIILNCIFDSDYYDKVPNGTYTLETDNKSKIHITVQNNTITNFKLLSSKKKFIKKEERIKDDDYCRIGGFNMWYGSFTNSKTKINESLQNIAIEDINDDNDFIKKYKLDMHNIFFAKYNDKILGILQYIYHYIIYMNIYDLKDVEMKFKIDKNRIYDNTYSVVYDENSPDIIIKNCVVEYYNKDILPLEFRSDNYVKYE